jgi:hypothetical protein
MRRSAILGAVVCSLFAIAAGAGESEGTHGTFAKPVKRDAPSYPPRLLNKGQQGSSATGSGSRASPATWTGQNSAATGTAT